MFMGSCEDTKLLNFLIDELNFADVPFRFAGVAPLQDTINMKWYDSRCQVSLVSSIVSMAKSSNGSVIIGVIDAQPDAKIYNIFAEIVVDNVSSLG